MDDSYYTALRRSMRMLENGGVALDESVPGEPTPTVLDEGIRPTRDIRRTGMMEATLRAGIALSPEELDKVATMNRHACRGFIKQCLRATRGK